MAAPASKRGKMSDAHLVFAGHMSKGIVEAGYKYSIVRGIMPGGIDCIRSKT